jgi:hypothetical protein
LKLRFGCHFPRPSTKPLNLFLLLFLQMLLLLPLRLMLLLVLRLLLLPCLSLSLALWSNLSSLFRGW